MFALVNSELPTGNSSERSNPFIGVITFLCRRSVLWSVLGRGELTKRPRRTEHQSQYHTPMQFCPTLKDRLIPALPKPWGEELSDWRHSLVRPSLALQQCQKRRLNLKGGARLRLHLGQQLPCRWLQVPVREIKTGTVVPDGVAFRCSPGCAVIVVCLALVADSVPEMAGTSCEQKALKRDVAVATSWLLLEHPATTLDDNTGTAWLKRWQAHSQ